VCAGPPVLSHFHIVLTNILTWRNPASVTSKGPNEEARNTSDLEPTEWPTHPTMAPQTATSAPRERAPLMPVAGRTLPTRLPCTCRYTRAARFASGTRCRCHGWAGATSVQNTCRSPATPSGAVISPRKSTAGTHDTSSSELPGWTRSPSRATSSRRVPTPTVFAHAAVRLLRRKQTGAFTCGPGASLSTARRTARRMAQREAPRGARRTWAQQAQSGRKKRRNSFTSWHSVVSG
jgi:hypothetical protein